MRRLVRLEETVLLYLTDPLDCQGKHVRQGNGCAGGVTSCCQTAFS